MATVERKSIGRPHNKGAPSRALCDPCLPCHSVCLCYFYRDDRRIEGEAKELDRKVDYGRDAHWLEPFFFGVVAYLIAFLPQSFGLAVNISVVGAISGVVAAGVSHFFLFTVARRSFVPVILSIVAGVIQGMLSGLLFRSFAASLLFSPLVHGAVAGSLTYLMTSLRGRSLASRESVATSGRSPACPIPPDQADNRAVLRSAARKPLFRVRGEARRRGFDRRRRHEHRRLP